jgi:hypothetical protein
MLELRIVSGSVSVEQVLYLIFTVYFEASLRTKKKG